MMSSSHINHLKHIINMTKSVNAKNVFIHAFTDGRDVDAKSGINFISEIIDFTKNKSAEIATVCRRYYSMDRDLKVEKNKKLYDLLVNGIGEITTDILRSIENSYEEGVTDEFINPLIFKKDGQPITNIKGGGCIF